MGFIAKFKGRCCLSLPVVRGPPFFERPHCLSIYRASVDCASVFVPFQVIKCLSSILNPEPASDIIGEEDNAILFF